MDPPPDDDDGVARGDEDGAAVRGKRHSGTTPFSSNTCSTCDMENELSGLYHDNTRGTSGAANALLLLLMAVLLPITNGENDDDDSDDDNEAPPSPTIDVVDCFCCCCSRNFCDMVKTSSLFSEPKIPPKHR